MALICPMCGVATSIDYVMIEDKGAYLPDQSNPSRQIFGKARVSACTDFDEIDHISFSVLKCQSCQRHFVAKLNRFKDEEWIPVFPIPIIPVATELPELVKDPFEEAQLCFSTEAYRACVCMCQIVLEILWREQECKGLNELKDKDVISGALLNRANEIRLWANIAKHELLPTSVSREDVQQLMSYLETILNHVYVEPARLEALKQKREQRNDDDD